MRRYGPTLDDVVDYLESGSSRLVELDSDADRIETLGAEVAADRARLDELAAQLTARRTDAAERLSAAVTRRARRARDARRPPHDRGRPRPSSRSTGRDQVAIMLQPHAGTEPRPLATRRIGRRALAGHARDRGRAGGDRSGADLRLRRGGCRGRRRERDRDRASGWPASPASAQVIVVTHLAQVAAFSNNHLVVEKGSDGSVTTSSVRLVHADERAAEMARLLSGSPESDSALTHARELLEAAHGRWE